MTLHVLEFIVNPSIALLKASKYNIIVCSTAASFPCCHLTKCSLTIL